MKGLVPLAMLLIGRGRPREHHKGTSDRILPIGDFISDQKAQLRRILCNVRLRMRAPKEYPSGSRDLWSLYVTFDDFTFGQKAPLG